MLKFFHFIIVGTLLTLRGCVAACKVITFHYRLTPSLKIYNLIVSVHTIIRRVRPAKRLRKRTKDKINKICVFKIFNSLLSNKERSVGITANKTELLKNKTSLL